jgi:hypothetical protein
MPRKIAPDAHQSPIEVVVDLFDRGFDLRSWHGPNLRTSFRGINAKQAAKRVRNRKTIWQQLRHCIFWKTVVLRRLAGQGEFPHKGRNWPPMPAELSDANWRADVRKLEQVHAELRSEIAKLNWKKIDPLSRMMAIGVAFHDIYHAGQINALKREVRGK